MRSNAATVEAVIEEVDVKYSIYEVPLELHVAHGQLSIFAPLPLTIDQPQIRRIQEKFINLTYSNLHVSYSLLNDYESMIFDVSLHDFHATEIRSNQHTCDIIRRKDTERTSNDEKVDFSNESSDPLLMIQISKNSKAYKHFKYGIECRIQTIIIDIVANQK